MQKKNITIEFSIPQEKLDRFKRSIKANSAERIDLDRIIKEVLLRAISLGLDDYRQLYLMSPKDFIGNFVVSIETVEISMEWTCGHSRGN